MNKAVTEGLILMPPPFADGLNVWSSGDGTPGSPTYDGAANAAFVPSDPDFEGCLELLKTSTTQKLRWKGETPVINGLYLRVTARVKAMSGALPSVRIAGFAANGSDGAVSGVTLSGPSVALTTYGEIVEVSAIIATAARGGVDMPWAGVDHGHVGLDLTGANGGVVRIDDITIEDVTSYWLRDMMDWVDVRDYGAVGNGVADDYDAFVAAANAAQSSGRELLVSAGAYYIGQTLTIEVPVRFQGRLSMPSDARLQLTKNFDFPSYAAAFNSEGLGLRKGLQALFFYTDHDTFDLMGRRVQLDAPIDLAATTGLNYYAIRRVLRNGLIEASDGAAWNTQVSYSQGTYSTGQQSQLTNVTNIANIPVGARVEGSGVGREVYVKARNVSAQSLTLSQPLFNAQGTQNYTFRKFQHILDMSGFGTLERFEIDSVEFQCRGICSALSLSTDGPIFTVRDCTFNKPKDKAITSIGRGCQGMLVDRCTFLSSESPERAQDRVSVAINVNANDVKLRSNLVQRFGKFAVMAGTYHLIEGNHFYHGDNEQNAVRQAGIVLTYPNTVTSITGNYVDNTFFEHTNEHDATPNWNGEYSFGGLSVTNNIFLVSNVISSFRFIVVKPYGTGHFLSGQVVSGNVFRTVNATPSRADGVNTSYADLDYSRFRNVIWQHNTYNGIQTQTESPLVLRHTQSSEAANWTISTGGKLPYDGWARTVSSIVMEGQANGGGNEVRTSWPYVVVQQGSNRNQVRLTWPSATRGRVVVTVRGDNPL
ncbi:glycosyl hydrolase family 28-related protein [Pararhodobacter zhoushanensis]|uniref:glycosyl hydrolase family 28-related protein n=1 Tax=Pararhodobacter zhoushanensis TaxID=2479545 RepID=UPI000F8E084F|nr:glycosyl hydrolase family 28-related protein [Pararhodobacter zhoushanensis]